MSTKTTFKRIALVAVAALGLGVLSVAPSSADVSGVTVTVTNGTATTLNSDSTTAAKIKVQFLALAGSADSVTVAVAAAATAPAGATVSAPKLMFFESTTSVTSVYAKVDTSTINAAFASASQAQVGAVYASSRGAHIHAGSTANGTYSATMKFWLGETSTGTLLAGTYSYNAIVTSQNTTANAAPVVQVVPFTITVSAVAAASTVASSLYSDAFMASGAGAATADGTGITALATASSTAAATVTVNIRNASNLAVAQDTVTVTVTGPGIVTNATAGSGKSLQAYLTGSNDFVVTSDGTAGLTTITVTTAKSGISAVKTMSFYTAVPTTIAAVAYNPVLAVGANASAVAVKAIDSNGNAWTGTLYISASTAADALVLGAADPVACSNALLATTGYIFCPITALSVGTGNVVVTDAAAGVATATSNVVALTVKAGVASSVKIAFDKTTYAPNEKARITVTPLDATGSTLQGKVFDNLLATGGISATSAFSTGSMDSLTAVSYTTATASSATSGATAGAYTFTVYMPSASGDVTLTATGGTDVAAAGRVAVTATATVVNSSVDAATDAANEATDAANAATDAALAAADSADAATEAAQEASDAVAELSTQVAALMASLKAQIKSLTNLVIKIQKKLK